MNNKIAVLLGSIWLVSCQPKMGFDPTNVVLTSECPKQATCDIKILSGKSILFKNDGINSSYTLEESADKNVIVYQYDKIVKGNLQDAGYREEIVFELHKNTSALNLTEDELQNTQMLFGRFCYCKGQTGYYPIRQGKLTILENHEGELKFTISEVPQVTKQIQFSLK